MKKPKKLENFEKKDMEMIVKKQAVHYLKYMVV